MTSKPLSRRSFGLLAAALAASPARAAGTGRDVFFVRHAESEVNIAFDPARPDSGVSYPLTQKGVGQAREMALALSSAPPAVLYASTQLRAVQTADAVSFRTGTPVRLAPELVEVEFGQVDRGTDHAQGLAAIRAIYMGWLAGRTDLQAPGGESFEGVRGRVLPFVRAALAAAPGDGPVVFVSHRATLMVAAPALFSNLSPAFVAANPLPNCGIAHGRLSGGALTCLTWAGLTPPQS